MPKNIIARWKTERSTSKFKPLLSGYRPFFWILALILVVVIWEAPGYPRLVRWLIRHEVMSSEGRPSSAFAPNRVAAARFRLEKRWLSAWKKGEKRPPANVPAGDSLFACLKIAFEIRAAKQSLRVPAELAAIRDPIAVPYPTDPLQMPDGPLDIAAPLHLLAAHLLDLSGSETGDDRIKTLQSVQRLGEALMDASPPWPSFALNGIAIRDDALRSLEMIYRMTDDRTRLMRVRKWMYDDLDIRRELKRSLTETPLRDREFSRLKRSTDPGIRRRALAMWLDYQSSLAREALAYEHYYPGRWPNPNAPAAFHLGI